MEHCVGYRQSLERCCLQEEFSCQREGQGWRWLSGDAQSQSTATLLDALPAEVRRIDRQSFSVLVFWVEPESIETLGELDKALQPLREGPSA